MDPGSAAHHFMMRCIRGTSEIFAQNYDMHLADRISATLRTQSRHRQSSPSTGMGNRAVSVAHRQSPPGLQENSAPQREQARRREESVRSFMTAL
jgi:hypothetical protein